MKALLKKDAVPGLSLVEVERPVPGPGDVLIRVIQAGICGTDVHIYHWDQWSSSVVRPPLVPGHEFVGVVEWAPPESGLDVGMVVGAEGHIPCGTCGQCQAGNLHLCAHTSVLGIHRPGAFAEYVVLPANNVWRHEKEIDLDIATLFDPLGNAVHAAMRFPVVGEDVLITGAGPIGLMTIAICRRLGVRRLAVADPLPSRRALATKMGADLVIDPQTDALREARQAACIPDGFTVGLEMSGSPHALALMIEHARPGCQIAALGLPGQHIELDWATLVTKMITVQGIYGRRIFETWRQMTTLLEAGLDIDAVITSRFPFHQFQHAFATAAAGASGKVLLDWRIG